MDKIIYQGQAIAVTKANEEGGDMLLSGGRHYQGEDVLWRDASGRYYLQRQLDLLDIDTERERRASGRVLTHRLSLIGAMQWATSTSAETYDLRFDVTQALTAARGFLSPGNAKEVTVPLTLPVSLYRQVLAMGAYDERDGFNATVLSSVRGPVQAWLEFAEKHPDIPQFLEAYEQELDAGVHPDVWPPQSQLTDEPEESSQSVLDLLDANLGLDILRYKYLSPWAYTSADVVNGCVALALGQAFEALEACHQGKVPSDEGFVDNGWGYLEEAICDAAHRRNGDRPVQQKASLEAEDMDLRTNAAADRPDLALCAAGEVEPIGDQPEGAAADDALPDDDDQTPWGQQAQLEPEGGK